MTNRNYVQVVLWGAGEYGRRTIDIIGVDCVLAIIDSDKSKFGLSVSGIPVISLEQYINEYSEYLIVISVREDEAIRRTLEAHGLIWYLSVIEMPPETLESQCLCFDALQLEKYAQEKIIGIYGMTLFGMFLYVYLLKQGYKNLWLINNQSKDFVRKLENSFPLCRIADSDMNFDIILVTNKEITSVSMMYLNAIVDDVWDFSYGRERYKNPILAQFKGICKDRRLFIVGTGPSLKVEDLDCLKAHNEITMSVNKIFRGFHLTKWRPAYYVVGDREGIKEYGDEIKRLALPVKFVAARNVDFWDNNTTTRNIYRYHFIKDRIKGPLRISDDIVCGVYEKGTVIVVCLQIAFYMGAKEIYLLGTDFDYHGAVHEKGNHFIDNYGDGAEDNHEIPFQLYEALSACQSARIYAEKHGIKIYNATRGGKLEVFERVDFDSLF